LGVKLNLRRSAVLVTALFAIAVISGCSGGSDSGGFRRFNMKVDTAVLGPTWTAGGVSLRIPRDWEPLTEDGLLADSARLTMTRKTAYRNARTGSVMVAGLFGKSGATDPKSFAGWAQERLLGRAGSTSDWGTGESRLMVNEVRLVQVVVADSLTTHFRVIVESNPPVGLEYTVPQSAMKTDIKAVESSMGSIHKG
jgi:hypothetical protein